MDKRGCWISLHISHRKHFALQVMWRKLVPVVFTLQHPSIAILQLQLIQIVHTEGYIWKTCCINQKAELLCWIWHESNRFSLSSWYCCNPCKSTMNIPNPFINFDLIATATLLLLYEKYLIFTMSSIQLLHPVSYYCLLLSSQLESIVANYFYYLPDRVFWLRILLCTLLLPWEWYIEIYFGNHALFYV